MKKEGALCAIVEIKAYLCTAFKERLTSSSSPRHDKVSLRLLDSFESTSKMNKFLFAVNSKELKKNGVFLCSFGLRFGSVA